MTTVTARAKAFSCEGIRTNKFRVYDDGSAWVWDSVAGHYTTCHAIGRSAIARIRRLAAAARK